MPDALFVTPQGDQGPAEFVFRPRGFVAIGSEEIAQHDPGMSRVVFGVAGIAALQPSARVTRLGLRRLVAIGSAMNDVEPFHRRAQDRFGLLELAGFQQDRAFVAVTIFDELDNVGRHIAVMSRHDASFSFASQFLGTCE